MSGIANYAVVVFLLNGQIERQGPNTGAFTYMASCITITLGMLSTPMAQQALTTFAIQLDSTLPRPPPATGFRNLSQAAATEVVRLFLQKLRSRFPVIVIDQRLGDNDYWAYHARNGPANDFDTRHHSIHVNYAKISKMDAAAERSPTDFRTWQFIFTNILFHEIAHLFVTFLGYTDPGTITPEQFGCGIPVYSQPGRGEAGRWFESVVFGGIVEFVQDPHRQDDQQPGIPHIFSLENGRVIGRKISQRAIDQTLNCQPSFPYQFESSPIGSIDVQNNRPSYACAGRPVTFAFMAQSELVGYNIDIGEGSTVRDVPGDASARIEQA